MYYINHPEYKIVSGEHKDSYELLAYFYDDERMLYSDLKFEYLTTIIDESELWFMDMGRCIIPKPETRYIIGKGLFYYFLKDSMNGKLNSVINCRNYCCNRSGIEIPAMFFKLKKKEEATKNNLLLAKYYLDFAEGIFQNDIQGALRCVNYYQKGIKLYRDNGEPQKAEIAHKRLVEIQKEIPQIMVPFSIELDIKGVVDNIKINMEGLTFEEGLIRLTQMFVFEKQEDIKNRVIGEFKDHPLAHMFGKSLINAQGQTVLTLPPLDIQNPEKDPHLLELHMYQNALEKQKISGDIWMKNALAILRDTYVVENSMLDFLVKDNPIIPDGREHIFQSALRMFLNGEFYEAMHILAPQVENLFRNIAKEVGGLTVTLKDDGSSMEKVLSSILSLPELLDCYDNDILFTFRGLLNEQAGANIRNEIAHGS